MQNHRQHLLASQGWQLRITLLLLMSLFVSGCGFQLRGTLPLEQYQTIYLQADSHAELAVRLRDQLRRNDVTLLPQSDPKHPIIQLANDRLQRRTLSLFPNGQVAEYELIYTVSYQVTLPGKEPEYFEIELFRDYQDDPNAALAKARELDLMLSELRQQAVARIIRQLGQL